MLSSPDHLVPGVFGGILERHPKSSSKDDLSSHPPIDLSKASP